MSLFGLGGGFSKDKQKSKQKSKEKRDIWYWTPEQRELASSFIGDYLTPRLGQGLPAYTGQLPGTAQSAVFNKLAQDAMQGTGAFAAWNRVLSPQDWEQGVQERLAARERYMQPIWQKEDAALKESMRNMGLQHSTDMLKKMADIHEQRAALTDMFAQNLYDQYEQMGLQVAPQVVDALSRIGAAQYQMENAGLEAQFREWLRTQPEYSPVLEQILDMLKLTPVQKGKIKTKGKAKGSASGWDIGGGMKLGF
ncbi:MAG: hypothetical protein JRJ29_00255 [Deltaproteobacteria bacterium]|nr:hypothetical protein [Deltaproteobacteria bacterium]MBW2081595.1 hypothetical protein [Deltaproteobacteria bacterium]